MCAWVLCLYYNDECNSGTRISRRRGESCFGPDDSGIARSAGRYQKRDVGYRGEDVPGVKVTET